MGESLSMFVERRDGQAWVPADPPVWTEGDPYFHEDGEWEPEDLFFETCGRSRDLAALLLGSPAGVGESPRERDSVRHARPLPGHPRGLPAGLSPLVAARAARIRPMFGATWLLLREVLEVDWEAPYSYAHAYVRREDAPSFDGVSFPAGWPDDRELFRARWVSDEATLRWLPEVGVVAEPWRGREIAWEEVGPVYTRVRWVEKTYADAAGACFMDEVVPRLKRYGDPDVHRLVVWSW